MKFDRSPLRNSVYRRLFAAQLVALFGTGLTTVALALLAYDLASADAGLVLGTALALKMVAYVFVAPVFGSFVHRLDRRRTLILLDLSRAGLVACLPFVTETWQVYALIFLINACSAGFTPMYQAIIPQILPNEDAYTRALSLSRLAYDLENLISPLLAAALLLTVSYTSFFGLNAAAFIGSALLVFSVSLPAARRATRSGGVWTSLSFGIWAYLKTPRLRALLALSVAVAAAGAMVIVNTVVYVREVLAGGETETALVLAAAGGGSMVIALLMPALLERASERRVLLWGGGLLGVGLALGLTSPGLLQLMALWFVLGAGLSLIQTPAGRLVARSAGQGDQPALFAAQFSLSHACWFFGYLGAGWLVASYGFPLAFGTLAIVCLLATSTAAWLWRSPDETALWHHHEAITHSHDHVHDEHHQHEHRGDEGPEPHTHLHTHEPMQHRHAYHIDSHHAVWPR